MLAQELMLNQNANLNFQYNSKMYKVSINIHEGLVIVKELISEDNYNYLSITNLNNPEMEVTEN